MKTFNNYSWIVSILITILGWVWVMAAERAVTGEKLDELDGRVSSLTQRNETLLDRMTEMNASLIAVRTDVRWLRQEWRPNPKPTE